MERLVALLRISQSQTRRAERRRTRLIAAQAASVDDVHRQEALVSELTQVNHGYAISNAACLLALFGSMMSAEQFASFSIGSYPYPPSKTVLTALLLGAGDADDSDGSS
jgi:hypothetical protein